MNVVVTGAFGNVGRSTVRALLEEGEAVSCFELPTKKNRKLSQKPERLFSLKRGEPRLLGWQNRLHFCWGDIRSSSDIEKALAGADAVCHLAALIPPAADADPALAYDINVNGTRALLSALKASRQRPLLVYASSVAVYGDRLRQPHIGIADPLIPSPGDPYAAQKILCEAEIRESECPWIILRLSFIVWAKKFSLASVGPLMFRMPLGTMLEVCHTQDAGLAFAHAAHSPLLAGSVFNIGGGASCRTSYREYIQRMFLLFGLGGARALPEAAFSQTGYHCGFMDSQRSEDALHFQRNSIEDYYRETNAELGRLRPWLRPLAPLALKFILRLSPYWTWMKNRATRKHGEVKQLQARLA